MYKLLFILSLLIVFVDLADAQQFEEMTDISGFRSPGNNFGVAIGDVNVDGYDDIYITRRGEANLLYINQGNFTFEEKAEVYGLDHSGENQASLWIDYDNDGDLDLFMVNNEGPNQFYENDQGVFTNETFNLGLSKSGFVKSVNAVDYDNDGFLDIYVSYFLKQNVLYKNFDGEYFLDVTVAAGIDDQGPSMGSVFFDYDNDGDQDLYQVHDGNVANLLYQNQGDGSFIDVSATSKSDYAGFGMGVDAGDVNNDGYLDLYITNLEENTLLINQKDGTFEDLSSITKVDDIGMGWGTFLFDCNNDGHQDIYVANESDFGVQGYDVLKNILYKNLGNLIFDHDSYNGGIQNTFGSYGAAYSDFDQDGLLDFVVANQGTEGNQIFHNISESNNYISFSLIGKKSNAQAIGAKIEVFAGGQQFVRERKAGSSWISQSGSLLHFGLGNANDIDSVVISWPSGIRQVLESYSLNSRNIISEPSNFSSGAVVWTEPAFPSQFDDVTVYFDAAEGNKGLQDFEGAIYAHTGVITSNSNSSSDWKHVVGTWGTDVAETKMTNEGDNIYSLALNINDFYGVDDGESVEKLAFVFRNVDGSVTGRDEGGGDIFADVYPPDGGLLATILSPSLSGDIIYDDDSILVNVVLNTKGFVSISDNGANIFNDSIQEISFYAQPDGLGAHSIEFLVSLEDDTLFFERSYFVLSRAETLTNAPAEVKNGLNYFSDSTYIFQLYAPNKEHVFLLCPANDYAVNIEHRLSKAEDEATFWIELDKDLFTEGKNNYQYLVDGSLRIADPYSTVVLDPSNDGFVPQDVLDELSDYPSGLTTGIVTAFDVEKEVFSWTDDQYSKPDQKNLVVYEMLMRDFLSDKNYKSLLDTLDYFERLGVNAIELMPVTEFEGNQSWGYNISYHMALDKYYGSRNQFKAFINEAHNRGISVILDVVYNHVFSQSPLAQLYWDDGNFRPTAENPWLNVTAKHPFNVGYDVNHESQATKDWVKQTLEYWVTEFHIDGFRFDLSKGFTQTNSGGDDLFRQYDAGRIATLKDYADFLWAIEDDIYVTLEHFAANDEETELANYGMMLWGNMNHEFIEAAMGRASDLEWIDYRERGWNDPHLVGYMESHDEERMMVRILESGDSEGSYNTRDPEIALRRVAAASAVFYSIPGPKMLWQFGELGYDYSINWCTNGTVNGCRLDPKPVRWDYLEDENRNRLQEIISNIIHLKTEYPTFSTTDYTFNDGNFFLKTVHLNHEEMDAVVMANYRVTNSDINPKFQYSGVWYEYFTGDSLIVENTEEKLTHLPGEYRIYTSERITPPSGFVTGIDEVFFGELELFPNPAQEGDRLTLKLKADEFIENVFLIDNLGRTTVVNFENYGNSLGFDLPTSLPSGLYHVKVHGKQKIHSGSFVKR